MARVALKCGDRIVIDNLEYIIDSVVGDGATCIVYSARYTDHAGLNHSVLLKECYPYADNIIRDGNILSWSIENERQKSLSSFKTAYEKLMAMQNTAKQRNSTSYAFDLFEANGTLYSVTDITEGTTFDKDKSMSLADILKTVLALSKVIQKYHNNGYLHLDIKPGNFLVIPETRELVVLFDMDSVTAIEDIRSGKISCVPYSKGWAAPEQMQGNLSKLCPATDIYSIGAILFEKIMGRNVEPADTGLFADWDFDEKIFENVNPKIKRLLRNIFKKTLAANVKRRYQNVNELVTALEEAAKTAEQKTYLISDYIVSDINFVGRKDDLQKLDELFDNGSKAVFLHGFGGVGKTALATKYAESYGNQYDCVKFCRYTNGLKNIIDSLEIANTSNNDSDEHRKLLKTVLKDTNTLIIIDNFDVDDDEELECLLSLNFNVIFTTRNDYSQYISSEKIEIIELDSLLTDDLIQVFKNEYDHEISEREEELVQDIIDKFGNLTIIVPMIAKQILSSHISIEEFASSIEGDIFARFNEDNEDIRIRKDGKSQKINSLDYLRAMFNISSLSEEHKTVLRYLYLLRIHSNLTVSEYRKYTGTKNLNILNDLAFRNWITIEHLLYKDEDVITVHQLIYDLVEKDFYPSYESVPGITKYIESCFVLIENMLAPNQSTSNTIVDWDSAKCITFALLMYADIRCSESKETYYKKMSVLYTFMCIAFLEDAHKLYDLLFTSPEESGYYFNINGIMDLFTFNIVKAALFWCDYLALLKQSVKEDGKLSYDFSNGFVKFESKTEKEEFIELVRKDIGFSDDTLFSNQSILIPYFVMLFYFSILKGDSDITEIALKIIIRLEEIVHEGQGLCSSAESSEYSDEMIEFRLKYYQAICKFPTPEEKIENKSVAGLDVSFYYAYYVFVLNTFQYALSMNLEKSLRENYLKKAESLIVLIEEQNDSFFWYDMSEVQIMNYRPLSVEEHNNNKKQHWLKRSQKWYYAVEKTLEKSKNPFDIYKLLLSFDYQQVYVPNSKIRRLIESGFVETLYNDVRLTNEQKKTLLINYVVSQIKGLKVKGNLKKNAQLLSILRPKAELYFQSLSMLNTFEPKWQLQNLNRNNILVVDAAFVLRRILKKEFFEIDAYIESKISLDNIVYIGDLIYFADRIRMNGYTKKSKELKNKILNLCLQVNLSELPEQTIQMILYKIRPIAVKYNRSDILEKIDDLEITVERKYYLTLLSLDSIAFKFYEKPNIATKFLDDYIEAVATEAFGKMHDWIPVEEMDEMEKLFLEYDYYLLLYANMKSTWYARIFGNRALGENAPKGAVRQASPFEMSQFTYASYNPIVDIGVCYLLAESYDDIYRESMFDCPLEEVVENDGSERDYTLSDEGIKEVIDNIIKICPKAKKDIDRYFGKRQE